jgi:Domain of unknown function (DUF4920)
MKTNILFLLFISTLISCNKKGKIIKSHDFNNTTYTSFGDSISRDDALTTQEMFKKYETLKTGDTLNVKFKSNINAVCKEKGCWMKLNLGNENQAFVKFKDYAFFVPKNANNEEVIVNGKAFVSVVSIEEQKHYAQDDGKSQASIDSIVAPKKTYSFIADGVLIKN